MNTALIRQLLLAAVMLSLSLRAEATEALNVDASGLFIQGYDPVSYFDAGPKPGNSSLMVRYQGAEIHFSSIGNMEKFKASPASYMPRYGGYCAYGVRMGQKFDIDPFAYQLTDTGLYLLLDRTTLTMWDDNREHNIGIADRIWPVISEVPPASLASN